MQQPPQNRKYKKSQKMRVRAVTYSKGGSQFLLGNVALKALKAKRIVPTQIEAARKVISRKLKKKSKIWVRIFADIPVTQKPKEVRMGKGKGAVAFWIHRLNAGKIIFELSTALTTTAHAALVSAGKKLPIPSTVVYREK